jgi:hypothetical protein
MSTLRRLHGGFAVVFGFGLLLLCTPAFSQLNLGNITGTVTDSSGGVIAGATVTVTDVERGVAHTHNRYSGTVFGSQPDAWQLLRACGVQGFSDIKSQRH